MKTICPTLKEGVKKHCFYMLIVILFSGILECSGSGYFSSGVAQVTGNVLPGSINQQIIVVTVDGNNSGFLSNWQIASCSFTLNNTNNIYVTEARLWMNSTNSFTGASQVGSVINNPSGTINFTINSGNIGNNDRFLFLTFSISSTAPCSGNSVDAFVPTNGLVITGNNGGNKTPSPNDPAGNRQIFNEVTPSISITSTGNGSCTGSEIFFDAQSLNGGSTPAYQWTVNNINAGTNSSLFSSNTLQNNDLVKCILTSNADCATPVTVNSNTIIITTFNSPKPKILPEDTVLCLGAIMMLSVIDTGVFSGGYPTGTIFDWGYGPTLNNTLLINGSGAYTVAITLPASFGSCFAVSNAPSINYIDAPVVFLTADTIQCHGATNAKVYAEIFLGTVPFHYKWYNNGILVRDTISSLAYDTLLNAGTGMYCLIVSDSIAVNQSGLVCASDSACIEVTGPSVLSLSPVTTHLLCQGANDGSIDITPSGGTPPFTFLWSNGQTTEDLNLLAQGTYTVTVTDAHLCIKEQLININLIPDNTPPVLNCPVDIFLSLSSGQCSGVVNYVPPSATDNCPGVQTIQTAGLPSGSVFPTGITANTFLATDSAGNTKTCTFNITVTEVIPPVISCSSDLQFSNDSGLCGKVVNYSAPMVSDNCSIDTVIQTGGLISGSLFPVGNTLNTFIVTDGEGNSSTCSFNVQVTDTEFPFISCIPDTQIFSNTGVNGAIFSYTIAASDNCSFTVNQTSGIASGSLFPVGTTLNVFVVTDASGNSSSCSFSVIVTDNEPPVAQCQNISVILDSNGTVTIIPEMVDGGSSDNTGILSRTVVPVTFTCSNIGDNTVLLTITDNFGNSSSCNATVTVSSSISANVSPDPVQLCQGSNLLLSGNPSGGSGSYPYHNWSGNNLSLSDSTIENVTFFAAAAGTYTLSYTVEDNHGCSANDSVTIQVFPALTGFLMHSDVACYGGVDGTVSISPSGGSGNVSYLWSNGVTTSSITGLSAGNYSVVVSDNAGCTISQGITLSEPPQITLSHTTTNESCNNAQDGTISIAVAGGVEPYNYLWNSGQTTSLITGLIPANYTATVTDGHGCTKSTSAEIYPLTITIAHSSSIYNGGYNINCNGGADGSIDLSVLTGLGPYSYIWNNGVTTEDVSALQAGTYILTVSNNLCETSDTITLIQPPALSSGISHSNVTCFNASNGIATVTCSGGVPEYAFSWNTSPIKTTAAVTGLSAGSYLVTVSDMNGCTQTNPVIITQPGSINISAIITHLKCKGDNNGAINISVNGGTPPYNFHWNGGVISEDRSGLKAKSYTVTVTDANGCTKKSTFNVTEPNNYLQLFSNKTNVRCHNGNTGIANVIAIGGVQPYTYSWNTVPLKTTSSINNLYAGLYSCNITDAAGCIKSVTITITQPSLIVLTTSQSNVTANGGNNGTAGVSVNGGTPGYSYQWNTVPIKTTASINNISAGTYTVKVTDSKGCSKTAVVTITQPPPRNTSYSDYIPQEIVLVYPNPSQGKIAVEFANLQEKELLLSLYDILGNQVYFAKIAVSDKAKNYINYDFSHFSKGIYFIEIKGNNIRKVNKIILE